MPTRRAEAEWKGKGDCVSARPKVTRVLSSWKNLIYFMVGNEWGETYGHRYRREAVR